MRPVAALAMAAAVAAAACDVEVPSGQGFSPRVEKIRLILGADRLVEGDTTRAQAIPLSADGDTLDVRVVWISSDPAVARIDASGEVVGVDEGKTTIVARAGARDTAAVLTVVQRVASIEIRGDAVRVTVGDTVQLAVELRDPEGRIAEDRDPGWGTTNPAIASVSKRGSVRGQSPGMAGIWARIDAVADTIAVRVSAAEQVSEDP